MDLTTLIAEAEAAGVQLKIIGDNVRIGTTAKNERWLEKLEPYREELLSHLQGEPLAPEPIDFPRTDGVSVPGPAVTLPHFPTGALPVVLRQWVESESEATQTPADLAGLLALSVCSTLTAKVVTISPRTGWVEPTNLFTAVLLAPGNRKSAVFADATKPLREIEAERIETARPEIAKLATRRRQTENRLKKLERKIAESTEDDPEARHEADRLAELLDREPVPALPRFIVDDATEEKLGAMLADQGGRLASMSPEGGVFDLMAGQYSAKGQTQFNLYLKAHAGDDNITDRIGRESVRIIKPALTCAYAIQPDVIRGVLARREFRGRGLLARFFYAAPVSKIGKRAIGADPVPQIVSERYHNLVRRLSELKGECKLVLDDDSVEVFLDWEAEIESMLADGGAMEFIRDWGAKLAGATLRIAAILHCVEHGTEGVVNSQSINSAIQIARYLIPHAQYVLNEMAGGGTPDDTEAAERRKLVSWIREQGGESTVRDLSHEGPRQFRGKIVEAEQALQSLFEAGFGDWIQLRPGPKGGRPSRVFRLNTTGPGTRTPRIPANIEVSVPGPESPRVKHESNGHTTEADINAMLAQAVEEMGMTCSQCNSVLTWAESRKQWGRCLRKGLTAEQSKSIMPRCQKCTTIILRKEC